MERLSPKDTAILNLEDDRTAAHGLTLAVFDGPEPSFGQLRDRVTERVQFIPRYRQRLVEVPLDIERPVWVDDPNFSVDFHLRRMTLPRSGRRQELDDILGRFLSQRLDRDKPLWELWIISGLEKGSWALISKVHYAVIDGVSGSDLIGLLGDGLELPSSPLASLIEPLPSQGQLVADAIADIALDPFESLRIGQSLARRPIRMARTALNSMAARRATDALGESVGPHRRWRGAEVSLQDLRAIRTVADCSVTDVILTGIAGGITAHLSAAGKPVPSTATALVPLSVGAASGGATGRITTVRADLPLGLDDPLECLRAISEQTAKGAARTGAIAGEALRRQTDFVAPTILGQGVRSSMLAARDDRRIDTAAINVPGPAESISVCGRTLSEVYPVIPLLGRIRIGFAVLSLGQRVFFGITADWDTSDDLESAARGVEETIEALNKAL